MDAMRFVREILGEKGILKSYSNIQFIKPKIMVHTGIKSFKRAVYMRARLLDPFL